MVPPVYYGTEQFYLGKKKKIVVKICVGKPLLFPENYSEDKYAPHWKIFNYREGW